MSENDPVEATRREFEAVMRLPRFASIEQVADDLGAVVDAGRASRPLAAGLPPAPTSRAATDLPTRPRV